MAVQNPIPTDEEALAAIAAAYVTLVSAAGEAASPDRVPAPGWRFSGRWWAAPVVLARPRPW
ncbi:MAG: hypothetical protein M0Z47_01135 [Actinomycetota bacterium]|nr:hypothetical protein [Actinomycetota bacterium]